MFKPPLLSFFPTSIVFILFGSVNLVAQQEKTSAAIAETSWTVQPNTLQYVGILKTVGQNVVWIAASNRVVHTTDAGANWIVNSDTAIGTSTIYAIDAISATTALVAIAPGSTSIFRTTDGGTSWTRVYTQPSPGFISAIKMMNATKGIALGDPVGGMFTFLWTSNGGATWVRTTSAPIPLVTETALNGSVAIMDTTHIWFGTTAGRIIRTTDGGATWWSSSAFASSVPVASIWFNDMQNGVVGSTLSAGSAARSTDGGATWTAVGVPGTGSIPSIAGVLGSVEFWAVRGPAINYTSNHGISWTASPPNGYLGPAMHISMASIGANVFGWASSSIGLLRYRRIVTSSAGPENRLPDKFSLQQNYPNPFNPTTTIRFTMGEKGFASLKVFNLLGAELVSLVNQEMSLGRHEATFDGRGLASGMYFYRLNIRDGNQRSLFTETKRLVLMR